MIKIKAHIAISLDGYIAYKDGETNWIPGQLLKEVSDLYKTSETLLAGTNTYNAIFEQCGYWPYRNTYVVSHYDSSALASENVQFLSDEPLDRINEIKQEMTGDILVIGGGNLITSLINNKLLDELNLYIVPVLLGEGIHFLGKTFDSNVRYTHSEQYQGTTKITYTFH